MTILDAFLAGEAHRTGRAQRTSTYRHRRLVDRPIVLVLWHLGAEPFTFAAVAYGTAPDRFDVVVPGEPRDRRLLFPVATDLARWFNARFEEPWGNRTTDPRSGREVAPTVPQLWVPNEGAVTVLGKLGRRLAYLPTEAREGGPPPADPALVRFGRHLSFLASEASRAGQQIVVAATTLAGQNWATEQTVAERANLAALDAWIDPPEGVHAFDAAARVEEESVGPLPPPSTEHDVEKRIESFNQARRDGDDSGREAALERITAIYEELSNSAWRLTWRVLERERSWPEEPRFVERRWQQDVDAYSRHMSWTDGPVGGRRRTRQTMPQAIRTRAEAEGEKARVEAEEAVSDPLHMIPQLLDHRAIEGHVVGYDSDHKEIKRGNKQASRVPVVTLVTTRPSLVPPGKELWWTVAPDRVRVVVDRVEDDPGGGSRVELKVLEHLADAAALAATEGPVCFSQLTTGGHWSSGVSTKVPWSHRPVDATGSATADLEEVDG